MGEKSFAILMTCFNRAEKTLKCLDTLHKATLPTNYSFEVFLVDDASKDNSAEKIKQSYPLVNVINGTGNLFWCGGTNLAWVHASEKKFDYYIWLNDDTYLLEDTWDTIAKCIELLKKNNTFILVGTTVDLENKKITYGGRKNLNDQFCIPNGELQQCSIINGNFVIIPHKTYELNGYIDNHFTQGGGDIDYGLRAIENGVDIYLLPKVIGQCNQNGVPDWCNKNVSFRKRWKVFHSPKGLNPKEFLYLIKRHFPSMLITTTFKIYLRVTCPYLWKNK